MKRAVTFLRFIAWSGLASFSGALLIATSAYLYLSPSLPSIESLKDTHLKTPLRVYSRDNKLIAEFGEQRRTPVTFEDIPHHLIQAFMAAEDDRFYSHHGVDVTSLMRAAIQLISTGHIQSGGSTITMQVAKNFFLSHDRVFSRKFNEILLALQIEQNLSKEDIFELYLNKIYLGNRAYGIEAAAQVYYGKSINNLSLAQFAMIAGLPKAPSRYNPINDPKRSIRRRNWILARMRNLDYITNDEYQLARNEPVSARYHGPQIEMEAPYVAEMVRQEMIERYDSKTYTEGFRVYTTIDSTLQEQANASLAKGLFDYSEKHGFRGPVTNLNDNLPKGTSKKGVSKKEQQALWQKALSKSAPHNQMQPAVVTQVMKQSVSILLKQGQEAVINWENLKWARHYININAVGPSPKTASDILKTGDLIWVRTMNDGHYRLSEEPEAQSSLLSMNPENGAILALVGGFNFYDSMYNRTTQAVRQAGSSFKPFIYLSAINFGMTAATLINDAPLIFNDKGLEGIWRPDNDNMTFSGPTRLREGLYRSRNLVSIRALRETGINRTVNFLASLGLPKDALTKNLSLSLGNVAMTPLELTTAWATIANGGYKVSPYLIDRIDIQGDTLFQANPLTACTDCDIRQVQHPITRGSQHVADPDEGFLDDTTEESDSAAVLDQPKATQTEQVMDERVNYIINDMMKDVISRGTGRRAKALNRHDIGGKTGTTNDNKDVWFIGFNPKVLTSVWIGMDNNTTLGKWEYGANTALPVWIDFMKVALADQPEVKRPQPEGIETVRIDPDTGLLAHPGDREAIFEIFRKEKTPKETSSYPLPTTDDHQLKPEDLF